MNQSAYIGGALVGGFALFLAARGRLVTYANVLWGPTKAPLLPFGAIPLFQVTSGPANENKPGGGGGGLALPAAGSASSAVGAANENAAMGAAGDAAAAIGDVMSTAGEVLPYLALG